MESQNIQPSFEIQRFLEKFELTKRAYFALIMETGARLQHSVNVKIKDIKDCKGSCQEVEEEIEDAIQQ